MVTVPEHDAGETPRDHPGILISEHYHRVSGYDTYRSKGTDDWLITFTLSGHGVFEWGDENIVCRNGDIVVIPPRVPHHYYTHQDHWEFVWAHFFPRPLWSHLLQLPRKCHGFLTVRIDNSVTYERIRVTFDRIIRDSREMHTNWQELCLSALEEILLLINRQLSDQSKPVLDPRIETTLQTLSSEMREQLTVADLAARVNLSPSRLTHLFKEQVGESVIDTLNHIRLRVAARYLQTKTMPVRDIAANVGFSDPFYFTRRFKSAYGVSPLEYRKTFKQSELRPDV